MEGLRHGHLYVYVSKVPHIDGFFSYLRHFWWKPLSGDSQTPLVRFWTLISRTLPIQLRSMQAHYCLLLGHWHRESCIALVSL
jgi:hypothetical protein